MQLPEKYSLNECNNLQNREKGNLKIYIFPSIFERKILKYSLATTLEYSCGNMIGQ